MKVVARRNSQSRDDHWCNEIVLEREDGVIIYYLESGNKRDVDEFYAMASVPDLSFDDDFGKYAGEDIGDVDKYDEITIHNAVFLV